MTKLVGLLVLGGPLFADAAAMTPNIFMGAVLATGVCWVAWRSPWSKR